MDYIHGRDDERDALLQKELLLSLIISFSFVFQVNLTGGYYDAGDNVKFGFPMAFTVTLLSWSAIEFRNEVTAAGQLRHLRSAIQWGADFLLRALASPTALYTQVHMSMMIT